MYIVSMKIEKDKGSFYSQGGTAFKKKYGKGAFKTLVNKRWDRHYGRICLNCDKTKEEIEKNKTPCQKIVRKIIMVDEVITFKKHEFNDPANGRPKPRKLKDS